MAGIIVPICEKRIFEYGYLTGGATQDVVLHPAVDVGNWYRVRAVVLVHQITATTGNFVVKLQHTFPTENDRQEFVDTSDFLATASITSASTNIKTISGTDPQAYLKVILRATQGTSGNTLYGEFSVYLVLLAARFRKGVVVLQEKFWLIVKRHSSASLELLKEAPRGKSGGALTTDRKDLITTMHLPGFSPTEEHLPLWSLALISTAKLVMRSSVNYFRLNTTMNALAPLRYAKEHCAW